MKKKLDAFRNWLIDKLGGYTQCELDRLLERNEDNWRLRVKWRDRVLGMYETETKDLNRQVSDLKDCIAKAHSHLHGV